MEHHLHIGVLLLKQGQHIGQECGPPPGGHPDVEHRPLPVLKVPQVADQLPVQKALPLQIGVEQLPAGVSRSGEWERSSRTTPRLPSSLARYWLRYGWERYSRSAAREMLRSLTMVRK